MRKRHPVRRNACFALAVLALAVVCSFAPATGRAGSTGGAPGPAGFLRGTLPVVFEDPTSLAFGPDGRLYVASLSSIDAITIDPATKAVTGTESIASGLDTVLGIAFDPTTPSPITVYATRQDLGATAGFQGAVSKFTAPGWAREDVITGLPTSAPFLNHLTNGLAFDAAGRLYIAQGSATDSGITDPPGSQTYWPETPLSAAILVADIHAPGFDGTITHAPPGPPAGDSVDQTGGDVAVLAAGLRNPYDVVVHSNGRIYATDNGPLGLFYSASCTETGATSSVSDELNVIEPGNYYGHPNRNRGRVDPRQCIYHPPDEGSGLDFTGPIATLPDHCSCDGIVEYTSAAFGGSMRGNLIFVGFQRNAVYSAVLSADGRSVLSSGELATAFDSPLDVTMGPDGTLYIAQFNGGNVAYLEPDSDGDSCGDARELGPDEQLGGRRNPNNPWDFYDVNGDGIVTVAGDILAVAAGFGPAGGPAYAPALDRSPPAPSGEPWDLGQPDGAVTVLDDVYGAALQFGHHCL